MNAGSAILGYSTGFLDPATVVSDFHDGIFEKDVSENLQGLMFSDNRGSSAFLRMKELYRNTQLGHTI